MNKFRLFLMVGSILIPAVAFGAAAGLSHSEAVTTLENQLGYPRTEYVDLWFGKDVADTIVAYFLNNGYITALPKPVNDKSFRYPLTEVGIKAFEQRKDDSSGVFTFHSYEPNLFLAHLACARTIIKTIQRISIDSHGQGAVVMYSTAKEPVEPLYSSVCSRSGELPSRIELGRTWEHSVKLRKYKEGWRVEK